MSAWRNVRSQAAAETNTLYLATTTAAGRTPPNSIFSRPSSSAETPMEYRLGHNGSSQVSPILLAKHIVLFVILVRVWVCVTCAKHAISGAMSSLLQVKRKLEMDGACPSNRVRRRISSTCSSEELRKRARWALLQSHLFMLPLSLSPSLSLSLSPSLSLSLSLPLSLSLSLPLHRASPLRQAPPSPQSGGRRHLWARSRRSSATSSTRPPTASWTSTRPRRRSKYRRDASTTSRTCWRAWGSYPRPQRTTYAGSKPGREG